MKRWQQPEPVPPEAYAALRGQPRLLASLLWRRGIRDDAAAAKFLDPSWDEANHDPFSFRDMRRAVDRLLLAIRNHERIVVHGDYDADGVAAAVILHQVLTKLGADVSVYLPHREKEGYGLSEATVRSLAAQGTKLIVTCDCGIASVGEISLAGELGIDVIVTDHHTIPTGRPGPAAATEASPTGEPSRPTRAASVAATGPADYVLPPAYAILHPRQPGETYPFPHLTGGGVAFKLAQALWQAGGLPPGHEKWLLDLVAVSTVADLGSLTGENRALVRYGLTVLGKTRRPGLAKLVELSGAARHGLDAGSIGFQIAPRINAAGRMDHANGAFDLLVATTDEEATRLAATLDRHNTDRRAATDKLVAEAREMAAAQASDAAIVVAGQGWPAALCGLIAARLSEDYYRPVIALGRDAEGKYVGSGRSINEFDITAALKVCSAHLAKFGGHPRACGLSIEGDENFKNFSVAFKAYATERLAGVELTPRLDVEERLTPSEATLATVESIRKLEPHGVDNPKPLFLLENVRVLGAMTVGDGGKHLRLTVADDAGGRLQCIGFRMGDRPWIPAAGDRIDAVVELDVNEWQGMRSPQGKLVDFRPSAPNI